MGTGDSPVRRAQLDLLPRPQEKPRSASSLPLPAPAPQIEQAAKQVSPRRQGKQVPPLRSLRSAPVGMTELRGLTGDGEKLDSLVDAYARS